MSATSNHLTCTTRPTPQPLLNFLIAGKLTAIRCGYRLLDFGDLPFVHRNIFLNRLRGDARTSSTLEGSTLLFHAFSIYNEP